MRFETVSDGRVATEWQCGRTMVERHPELPSAKTVVSALGDSDESDNDTLSTGDGEDMATKSNNVSHPSAESVSGSLTGFENVSIVNSNDVHFGNKTFYNGPVTIKQIIYSNPDAHSPIHGDARTADKANVVRLYEKQNVFLPSPATIRHNVTSTGLEGKSDLSPGKPSSPSSPGREANEQNGVQGRPIKSICGVRLNCLLAGAMTLAVFFMIITLTVLLTKQGSSELVSTVSESPDDPRTGVIPDTNYTSENVRFMPRQMWLAQPRQGELDKLKLPVPYVIISHTATQNCSTNAECVLHVRTIQTFHMSSKNWSDIGYSFLVGGDGFVYVGRGWDFVGAHTYGYNAKSIGISFIGTFISVVPPVSQLTAAKKLIELGITLGKISPTYKLLAHRQVTPTESPGAALYRELQTWPHWVHTP